MPKPFSRCVVGYGEPFQVPEKGDDAETLLRIARAVDEITRRGRPRDARFGPAPLGAQPRGPTDSMIVAEVSC